MRIRRQHRKVEGGVTRCHLQDLLLGEVEHFRVFVAPPDLVALGDVVVQLCVLVVEDLIAAVALEVELAASEVSDRPAHEFLVVPLLCEDVSQDSRTRVERIRIGRCGIADAAVAVHGDAGGLREKRRHRIGRTRSDVTTVKEAGITRETLVLQRKLCQLRHDVLIERAADGRVRVGVFHGFKVDVYEVSFSLRELDADRSGVNVIAADEV